MNLKAQFSQKAKRLLSSLFVLVFLSAVLQPLSAKEFSIEEVYVETQIRPDGTVRLVEKRSYYFDGDFSWADYNLPKYKIANIRDIEVREAGQPYTRSDSEQPGSYMVDRSGDEIEIKWYYDAEDEERTFTIAYTIEGVLRVGPEWSEFEWIFLSSRWDKDTQNATFEVRLPEGSPSYDLESWIHGPVAQLNKRNTTGGILVSGGPIDDDDQVKIRTIFPTEVLDNPTITDQAFSLEQAREEEAAYQQRMEEKARKEAERQVWGTWLTWFLLILSIGAYIHFFLKGGRRPKINQNIPKISPAIPDKTPPALVGYLIHQQHLGHPVSATLFDLCRKGWHKIEAEPGKKKKDEPQFLIQKSEHRRQRLETELSEVENHLRTFVDEQIENKSSSAKLDKLFESEEKGLKSSYKWMKKVEEWQKGWKKLLKKEIAQKNWFDEESKQAAIQCGIIQGVLFLVSILALIWAPYPGLIAFIGTLIIGLLSFAIYHRTKEGEIKYRKWKAYRKALIKADQQQWTNKQDERHFIYAVAAGLTKDQLKELFEMMPADETLKSWLSTSSLPHGMADAANLAVIVGYMGTSANAGVPGGAGGAGGAAAGGGAAGGAGGGAG